MKAKKLLALVMAVVMTFALAVPAFADGTHADPASGNASFSASGTTTFDVFADVTKSSARDSGDKSYYVTISWTTTDGKYTIAGDIYKWDAENEKYVRTDGGQQTAATEVNPATADITIKNQSNAQIAYEISYAQVEDSTESSTDSKTGTLASYITSNSINVAEHSDGQAEYYYKDTDHEGSYTAPNATYHGSITLNNYTLAAASQDDVKLGTYTVAITCDENVKHATAISITPSALGNLTATNPTVQLTAVLDPSDATDTVSWTSANTSIATVDQNGKVTAAGVGTTTITALTSNNLTASYEIVVDSVPVAVTGVTLSGTPKGNKLTKGSTATLTATVTPENATDKTVTWTSSDTAVATVENGVVTPTGNGTVTITATAGEKSASVTLTVSGYTSSVTLSSQKLNLKAGASETLTATIPTSATVKTVSWVSDNPNITVSSSETTVDDDGVTSITVTALDSAETNETATITVTSGDASATCKVVVGNVPAQTITLSDLTLAYGSTATLNPQVEPTNTTDTVSYTVGDSNIITVDADGTVHPVALGTTTVTATAGSATASCTVTVDAEYAMTGASKTLTSTELLNASTVTYTYDSNSYTAYDGYISATAGASWNDLNGFVTALNTAEVAPEGKTYGAGNDGVWHVFNSEAEANVWYQATSLSHNSKPNTLWTGVEDGDYAATAGFAKDASAITWSSREKSFGGSDARGFVVVFGKEPKVYDVESITLNNTSMALNATTQTGTLTADVSPSNASYMPITWTSDDTGVATVDSKGLVTAVGAGTATITATAGGKSGTCTVTVTGMGIVCIMTGSDASGKTLTSKGLLATDSSAVSYTDPRTSKTVYAYNGYISATGYANWADATAFVDKLNKAEITPTDTKKGTTGTWRLLNSIDDAKAWASGTTGEESGFGGVRNLWSSEEYEFAGAMNAAYRWNCNGGGWNGGIKELSYSGLGFVVVWAPGT